MFKFIFNYKDTKNETRTAEVIATTVHIAREHLVEALNGEIQGAADLILVFTTNHLITSGE